MLEPNLILWTKIELFGCDLHKSETGDLPLDVSDDFSDVHDLLLGKDVVLLPVPDECVEPVVHDAVGPQVYFVTDEGVPAQSWQIYIMQYQA